MSAYEKKRTIHPVQTLFEYDESSGKSCCKICNSRMEGKHSSNLLRHVQRKHEFEYEQVLAERKVSDPVQPTKRPSTGVVSMSTPIVRTPILSPITGIDRGKLKHPVHAYFDYDDFVDKSRCRLCEASFTGKHSQNLVKHLHGKHEECYHQVIEEREKQKNGQIMFPLELKFESDDDNCNNGSTTSKRHPVQDLFDYNDIVNKSRCKRCSQIFQGKHSENLLRHIKRKHESDYADIIVRRAQDGFDLVGMTKRQKRESFANHTFSNNNSFYRAERSTVPFKRFNVGLTAEKLINACVELVTTNGRPYSLLGDSGFRKIIDPILKGLGNPVTIDRQTIEEEVRKRAEKLRYELAVALKQKLISLKIDSTRNQCDRISLSISVQYIDDEKIVLKNLATREMPIHCPNENLGNIILEVLKEYNLSVSQIYSITTDYGTDICEENFSEMRDQGLLLSIGCIALTLQFAIDDVLKFDEFHFFLLPIRAIIAKLLEPENLIFIEKKQLPKPYLDNEVDGWTSTLEMLKRFLALKSACLELATTVPELHLNEEDWLKVERMIAALEPAKRAFDVLQTQQLTMTDFYNVWTKCKLESRKIQNNEYSAIMCKSFDGHEVNLMNNVSLLSTMYLDPRFQILLNDWQKQKAKEHLYTVYDKLMKLTQLSSTATAIQQQNNCLFPIDQIVDGKMVVGGGTPNGDVSSMVTNPHIEEEEVDELEAFLMQTEKEKRQFSSDFGSDFKLDIMSEMDKFNNIERIPLKSNVITYWQTKRISHPQLYSLAQVIFAVPATKTIVLEMNGEDGDLI